MTRRRRIAIAYLFAVPTMLGVVLAQHVAFLRLKHAETGMAQAAEALRECDAAMPLLNAAEVDAQRYLSGGDQGARNSFQDNVARLRVVLGGLHDLTDSPSQSPLARLKPLLAQRIAWLEQMMDKNVRAVQNRTASDSGKPMDDVGKLIAESKAVQQIRFEQQKEATEQNLGLASGLNTFGGLLAAWLVGVAAFLLFHDEKHRAWAGVERRVHTRVLESLPLGVCLSTEGGAILYANHAEEAALGYSQGELIGQNVKRLHASNGESGEPEIEDIIDRLGHTETWPGELAIRRKDGSTSRTAAWIMNMDVAGKLYRVFVHSH